MKKDLGMLTTSKACSTPEEIQSNSESSCPRVPGAACTKMGTQVVSMIHFRHSRYGWKAKKINFHTVSVSSPNSSGVSRNHGNMMTSINCPGATNYLFGP